jgi:hypothetical protein
MPDAGNTRKQAQVIATPATLRDSLNERDRRDFYRFTLNAPSSFNLQLNRAKRKAKLEVQIFQGTQRLDSTTQQQRQQNINTILDSGTYFIRIIRKTGNSSYRLRATAIQFPDSAGNSRETASPLLSATTSSTTAVRRDFVSSTTDSEDFYQFTLPNGNNLFGASLTSKRSGVTAQILDKDGKVLASGLSKQIVLSGGTYYLQVTCQTGFTSYNLRVASEPIQDLAGNSPNPAAARRINLISDSSVYTDFVSDTIDPKDYYVFTVDNDNTLVETSLIAPQSNVQAQVLTANGQVISTPAPSQGQVLLQRGTYYILVAPTTGFAKYNLTISGQVVPADAAGNTAGSARSVTLTPAATPYTDYIGNGFDQDDFYTFTLNRTTKVSASLDGQVSGIQASLLNSSLTPISLIGAGRTETILSAGIYYVRVQPNTANIAQYRLELAGLPTEPNDSGNTISTASAIGLPANVRNAFIGTGDQSDYYSFQLLNPGTLTASISTTAAISGRSSALQYGVYNASGGLVSPLSQSSLSLPLRAGIYYIGVARVGDAEAFYDLSINN